MPPWFSPCPVPGRPVCTPLHPGMATHPLPAAASLLPPPRRGITRPLQQPSGEGSWPLAPKGPWHTSRVGWRGRAVWIELCTRDTALPRHDTAPQHSPRRMAKTLQRDDGGAGPPSAEGYCGRSWGPHRVLGEDGPGEGGGAVQPLPLGFNRLVAYLTCPYHVMNQTLFPQI